MSGHGKLKVHQCLDGQAVHVEDALAEIEEKKRCGNADDSEHGGDGEHQPHIPGFGLVSIQDIVISDRQNRSVIEQRNHHDHDCRYGIEIEGQDA